jgi:hypothetical protein
MREDGSLVYEGRKERREESKIYHFPHSVSIMHADVAFKFFSEF